MKKYTIGNVREIQSLDELRHHQLRLELATEFLEDKIGDNLKSIKHQLAPRQLFLTLLSSVWGWVGGRQEDEHTAAKRPHSPAADVEEQQQPTAQA